MRKLAVLAIAFLVLASPSGAAALADVGGWSSPQIAVLGYWAFPSASGDGTRVVYLDPYNASGEDFNYDQYLYVVESTNGAWGTPELLAANGIYRPTGWGPVATRPVMSADGETLAYLGCTGNCKPINQEDRLDIYVSRRSDAGWSAPVVVASGVGVVEEIMGLSADGNTLTFSSDYLNFPFYQYNQIYVVEFSEGAWGASHAISSDQVEGRSPALSQDGLQVIWVSNPPAGGGANILMIASRPSLTDPWSAPQPLVSDFDLYNVLGRYRFSPDGSSVFYWKYPLVDGPGYMQYVSRDLYMLRRAQGAWSAPQKVTASPQTCMHCGHEDPPAVNWAGTRVIYPKPVLEGDTITGNFLEMTEFRDGAWSAPLSISTPFAYYDSINLSADGGRLVGLGPDTSTGGGALVWMEGMPFIEYKYWTNLARVIAPAQ